MVVGALTALALVACSGGDGGAGAKTGDDRGVPVVIVALDHPPVRQVMDEVDRTVAEFGDRVRVRRLDFESDEGQEFAEDRGVTGHVPLAIFIDASNGARVNGRAVRFVGFPRGQAPVPVAEGDWTLEDLRGALAQRAGEPR